VVEAPNDGAGGLIERSRRVVGDGHADDVNPTITDTHVVDGAAVVVVPALVPSAGRLVPLVALKVPSGAILRPDPTFTPPRVDAEAVGSVYVVPPAPIVMSPLPTMD
jgi:hypothetical protein